jgi:PAS domain S-box-containing protein
MVTDSTPYRILVIEDNPGDFVLVEDFLFEQIESPVIYRANTYSEAASILCTEESSFDVILLDLSLPDNTGEALIKDILAFCYHSPLIVLTGYADVAFGVKSLSWGVSDYILKEELTSVSLYKSIVYNIERKKSTLALEESERRYSDLFDLSPLPMWVVDLNTLEFLDVNKATVANYGYSRDEFLHMTLRDIRPPQDLPKLYEALALGRQHPDAPSQRIMVHRMKNGDIRNVDLQISPILYKNRKVSIVIATDITERLKYTQAIE